MFISALLSALLLLMLLQLLVFFRCALLMMLFKIIKLKRVRYVVENVSMNAAFVCYLYLMQRFVTDFSLN